MTTATSYDSPDQRYSYKSALIDRLRATDQGVRVGRLTLRLAQNFGFCWGVDRAVAMVWDCIRAHPGRRIWLLNQIIHNPKVNEDFHRHGVHFAFGPFASTPGLSGIRKEDVVVIPAFSAEVEHRRQLDEIGCEIVDTTCPWVEKPHRRVLKHLEDGFTVLIHGLRDHDETRATRSLVLAHGGHYLVVRDLEDTRLVCDFVLQKASREELLARLADFASPGFDPELHLQRIGVVNQTTMLASESREVAARVKQAVAERNASGPVLSFRDFDTICPATQDNQDAVLRLSHQSDLDLFLVLGGYDSSNTRNLLRAARAKHGAYHIQSPAGIRPETLSHRDPGSGLEVEIPDWLPAGPVTVGLSAGASTPDTELAEVIRRLCRAAGEPLAEEALLSAAG